MRPLKLHLKSFGPYLDEVIDFTRLEDRRLFVISGNTGSGKTMIFDAMCYALYEGASGGGRTQESLHSGFVPESQPTSVEFEFELRDRKYRIYRQMAPLKNGKREQNKGKYEIYLLHEDKVEQLYGSRKVGEFNQAIIDLIGLEREQFVQIVMLPQGEFGKLLLSDSKNKQTILRNIFQTNQYNDMVNKAKQRRSRAESEYNTVQTQIDAQLQIVKEQQSGLAENLQIGQKNTSKFAENRGVWRCLDRAV